MDISQEPAPTVKEWGEFNLLARYEFASRVFGINAHARAILRIMHIDAGGGWNASSLANFSGFSRTTVREILKRNVKYGLLAHTDSGYHLTPMGAGALIRIHRETMAIARGKQAGFSDEIIREFRYARSLGQNPAAKNISFPDDISILSTS